MTPIEAAEEILRCIDFILTQYPANQDEICEYDKQTQDLLHKLEFTNFTIGPGYKLARQLQDIRRKRRELKDENELMKGLFDFLSEGSSSAFKNGLIKSVQTSKRRKSQLEERKYKPRSKAFKGEFEPEGG